MADEELQPVPDDKVERLTVAVQGIADQAALVHRDVEAIRDRTRQDRKVTAALFIISLVIVGLVVAQVFVSISNQRTGHQISGCLTPQGHCAMRNSKTTAAILGETAHRNEVERLTTEIQLANAKGDTLAVQIRTQRLQDEENILKKYDEAIVAIQGGDLNHPLPSETVPSNPATP